MDECEYAPLDIAGSDGKLGQEDINENLVLEMVLIYHHSCPARVSIGMQRSTHTDSLSVQYTTVCYLYADFIPIQYLIAKYSHTVP